MYARRRLDFLRFSCFSANKFNNYPPRFILWPGLKCSTPRSFKLNSELKSLTITIADTKFAAILYMYNVRRYVAAQLSVRVAVFSAYVTSSLCVMWHHRNSHTSGTGAVEGRAKEASAPDVTATAKISSVKTWRDTFERRREFMTQFSWTSWNLQFWDRFDCKAWQSSANKTEIRENRCSELTGKYSF